VCSLQHSPSASDTCNAAELSSPQAGRLTSTGSLIRPMTLAATKETLPIAFLVRHGQAWQQQRPPRAARSKTQRSQKRAHSSTTCHLVPQASDSDASSSCVCCVRLPVSNHSGCTRSAARARRRSWPRLNAGDRVFAVLLEAFLDKLPYRIVDAALQHHADPHTQVLHSARVIMATSKHDARFGLAQLRARNCMP
jgi:hypothetical protein